MRGIIGARGQVKQSQRNLSAADKTLKALRNIIVPKHRPQVFNLTHTHKSQILNYVQDHKGLKSISTFARACLEKLDKLMGPKQSVFAPVSTTRELKTFLTTLSRCKIKMEVPGLGKCWRSPSYKNCMLVSENGKIFEGNVRFNARQLCINSICHAGHCTVTGHNFFIHFLPKTSIYILF